MSRQLLNLPTNINSQENSRNSISALTQENASKSDAIQIPGISLPKGGGALKGIDEKFEVNAANGTAAFNISLPVTPGRNGFSPALTLSYNSGAGNSPYGLGWSVGYPSIQRKTDKQLPRYMDGSESDVFMFSGAEDLVPFLNEEAPGDWQPEEKQDGDYHIKRYRPRIEGGFARIEKISHPLDSQPGHRVYGVYWKVTTRDNAVTIFGRGANARIADPGDETRIFQWLPEFSYDDKGNWIKYDYKAENLENVPDVSYENNRLNGIDGFSNKYLKRIQYGNRKPYYADPEKPYDPQTPADNEHFFELVFDYGEHDALVPTPTEDRLWDYRPDAFSNYRAGFEIRTNRLCKRVLMFHKFEELGDEPCLVRSLDFQYGPSSINDSGQTEVTYLQAITQTGYIRKPDTTYSSKSLPPMEFEYQQLIWDKRIKTVSRENIVNAPVGLTNNYQWVDLYGEGISGILTEQGGGWFYKSNLGDPDGNGDVSFTAAKEVIPKPSLMGIASGTLSIRDLEANGQKQVVVNSPDLQGFFQLTVDNDWEPFQSFEEITNIDLQDPNVRMIDLDGDGQPELVVSEDNVFVWFPANGKKGFGAAEFAAKTFDEEKGPAIVFADQEQSIFLADMSGDGLTDIVRIRNGEICYWANMGYGRFSAKVNMGNAPLFDHPGSFNPQYLHLADVSGTGATDIIYLGENTFKAYINLSGNAWSDAHEIEPFFPIDGNTQLSVIDLLGTGTSCIAWSSDLPAFAEAPMRYIDLMAGKKPHLLVHYKNNFGKETTLQYKSSTHFYLEDKLAGKPWITKLPFPVQVISKQIIEEKITDVRFTAEYRYHHGYYDHPEREFRGFGMVEQIDTEYYENWQANNDGNQLDSSEELYQAPVLTKTWFHTGAFLDRERILTQFKEEYWYEEYNRRFPTTPLTVTEPQLPDAVISDRLSAEEWPEALRACKGMVLRREVFSMDDPGNSDNKKQFKPYSAATHNCNIQLLQPGAGNRHGVFLVTESEAISIQYERDETDPRIAHTLNTKIDKLGNILEAASVVYPRLQEDDSLPQATRTEQEKTLITYTRNTFTNDVIQPDAYRLRVIAETETFELNDFPKSGTLYQLPDLNGVFGAGINPIDYQINLDTDPDPFPGAPKRRLIEHIRSLYYRYDLTAPLPPGVLESTGIPYESYQLAYTPALLQHIFASKIPDPVTTMEQGKFIHSEGDDNWWIRSGVVQLIDTADGETVSTAQSRFYSPIAYIDPFGSKTKVSYYEDYFLLIEETEDELQNITKVEQFDFRTLAPRQMRDINDNLSEVLVDELGLVKAVALQGNDLEAADNLNGLEEITENEAVDIQAFFQTGDSVDLDSIGRKLLQQATSRFIYDFDTYRTNGKPVVVAAINRETHHGFLADGEKTKLQISFEYSDGLGNVAMAKVQAEPGAAKQADVLADGSYTISDIETSEMIPPRLRWVGNGRTVLNNKGNPVKQYEPYFSVTPFYEDAKELVESGVTPVLYYDSPGRLIKTQLPDKTFTKVEFDAWKQASYDQNDTVKESLWYEDRGSPDPDSIPEPGDAQQRAAGLAAKHADTPGIEHLDTLGRPILSIEHNRDSDDNDVFYNTIIELDIEGNARKVIDARGNTVMEYKYDMLGHRVYQKSMDAGERWTFENVVGNPVRSWDSRDHQFLSEYDELHRPTHNWVKEGEGEEKLIGLTVYGETIADAKERNLRGQVFQVYDQAGLVENGGFDFKGNLIRSSRTLAMEYKEVINWDLPAPSTLLQEEFFDSSTEYDALDRVIKSLSPNNPQIPASEIVPTYNEANLLNEVKVKLRSASEETAYVKNIDYNEKGQRQSIEYGNNVVTKYKYDPLTFRLINLETTRSTGLNPLQDLSYTYDPVGNITEIEDRAQQTVFFNNAVVSPSARYVYDPFYRLIAAEGREHAGKNADQQRDHSEFPKNNLPHPNNSTALRRYTEMYEYDEVGNILRMIHQATNANWTRYHAYAADSNRLLATSLPGDDPAGPYSAQYSYDPHGSMTQMPHLPNIGWDFEDQMKQVNLGGGGKAYYVYDGAGQRVRKVVEKIGSLKEERIYLGGYEIYRRRNGTGLTLERETLHVMDDQERIALVETKTWHEGTAVFNPTQVFRYQLGNHLGSASLELDETGQVISYEEYHPYGTTAYHGTRSSAEVSLKRYRYTGKERDEESGLNYHNARYYAAWIAQWISADPIGLDAGVNLFVYCDRNPINKLDDSGTDWCWNPFADDCHVVIHKVPIWVAKGAWDATVATGEGIGEWSARGWIAIAGEDTQKKHVKSDVSAKVDTAWQAVKDPRGTVKKIIKGAWEIIKDPENLSRATGGVLIPGIPGAKYLKWRKARNTPKPPKIPKTSSGRPATPKGKPKKHQNAKPKKIAAEHQLPAVSQETISTVSASATRPISNQGNVSQATRKLQRRQDDTKATGTFAGVRPRDADALVRDILKNADQTVHGTISISGGAVKGISFNVVGTPGSIAFWGNRGVLYTDAGEFITFIDKLRPWPLKIN